jgi:spore maturation protein CgeB
MTTSPLAKALGYAKFPAGAKPRLMVMKSSYFVVEDVIAGARELGWEVFELPITLATRGSEQTIKDLLRAMIEFKPDFLFTVNLIGFDSEGKLAGLLEGFGIPTVAWFVDHPLSVLSGAELNARSNVQVFCFERSVLGWIAERGFEDPVHLPTASNPRSFHPDRVDPGVAAALGAPLSWVANSWWQKARLGFDEEVHAEALQLAATHSMDRCFMRDVAPGLMLASAPEARQRLGLAMQAALAEAAMQSRAEYVKGLGEQGLVVHGDEHWTKLVEGMRLERPVDFATELPSLFAGSRVNLNVTAEQMPTALNQRVWDVPGVGGFLLTDRQADVGEYFEEGVDVVTFGDLEEAQDKARFYLEHDSAREKIATKAFEKIEAEHRIAHRLLRMEEVLRKRFG